MIPLIQRSAPTDYVNRRFKFTHLSTSIALEGTFVFRSNLRSEFPNVSYSKQPEHCGRPRNNHERDQAPCDASRLLSNLAIGQAGQRASPSRNHANPPQALATDPDRRYNADTFLRNGGRMTSLLSHISAFEYWRHVGTPGFIVPEPSRTTIAPPNFTVSDFDWLVNTSVLSRPLHGLTSIKHKRTNEPAVRHVAYQELPFGSVCSISPEQRITSPELTIIQIAPGL